MISPSNAINTLSQSNETDATDGRDNISFGKCATTQRRASRSDTIALGGLLIIAFGIWFPTVELAETKGAMAMSEKSLSRRF